MGMYRGCITMFQDFGGCGLGFLGSRFRVIIRV